MIYWEVIILESIIWTRLAKQLLSNAAKQSETDPPKAKTQRWRWCPRATSQAAAATGGGGVSDRRVPLWLSTVARIWISNIILWKGKAEWDFKKITIKRSKVEWDRPSQSPSPSAAVLVLWEGYLLKPETLYLDLRLCICLTRWFQHMYPSISLRHISTWNCRCTPIFQPTDF